MGIYIRFESNGYIKADNAMLDLHINVEVYTRQGSCAADIMINIKVPEDIAKKYKLLVTELGTMRMVRPAAEALEILIHKERGVLKFLEEGCQNLNYKRNWWMFIEDIKQRIEEVNLNIEEYRVDIILLPQPRLRIIRRKEKTIVETDSTVPKVNITTEGPNTDMTEELVAVIKRLIEAKCYIKYAEDIIEELTERQVIVSLTPKRTDELLRKGVPLYPCVSSSIMFENGVIFVGDLSSRFS